MQTGFKYILIFFLVSFSYNELAFAQQAPVKKDSTILYKRIESYSGQGKLKNFMYHLVFKPVTPVSKITEVKKKGYKKLIQKPYSTFEGKIIRKIDIATLDPFGYSAADTNVTEQNFIYKVADNMHVKTQVITIRNLLLFHKNIPFNSLIVKESERLIRSQKYVHDVNFYVVSANGKSDSVDIFIRELDKWSIIPTGSLSNTDFSIGITEENFLGYGHEFRNSYTRNFTYKTNAYTASYFIPNISNTYINSLLHYSVDRFGNVNKKLAIDRPFFSPLAKWAAGVSFSTQYLKDTLRDINSIYSPIKLKFKTQDYWAGYAIRVFRDFSDNESVTNLILAIRFLNIKYFEKPSEYNDPLHIYSSENFYLASIGISTRKYVQDKYIFKYGEIEDVPVGKVFAVTGGYQVKGSSTRPYIGARISFGNYYSWGYLSSNFEYGTFFHSSHTEQGTLTAGATYFTGLIEIGRWKFRQFIKPQFIMGINRFSYDSLTLNDGYGLNGFHSTSLSGTRRLVVTFQTQSYSPLHLIGFHFGPFLVCSLGMLGDAATGFKNSRTFSQIGIGVLIKNENLVVSTFQLSISFYPIIRGSGQGIFKMNSFRTSDFGYRDFEIGKPGETIYQ